MKTSFLLFPLVSLFFASAPAQAFEFAGLRIGDTPARAIAREHAVKGKNVQGQCLPYALDLVKKLRAAGVPAQVIGYSYGDTFAGSRDWGTFRGHAVVMYEDGGRTYVMDNQSWTPSWVSKAADKRMATQFEGMTSQVVSTWRVKTAEGSVPAGLSGRTSGHHKHQIVSAASRVVPAKKGV